MTQDSKDIRKISFVAFNGPDGPENCFYTISAVKEIVMRRDGAGPMGWYDVVYVTTNEDMAKAALKAINDAGLAIVPREPTSKMTKDGAECVELDNMAKSYCAQATYEAMIEAGEIKG